MISQTRNKFCFAAVLTIFTHGIHYFVLDINPPGFHSELLWHATFPASGYCAPSLSPGSGGAAGSLRRERGTCLAYYHENQSTRTLTIVREAGRGK